MKLYVPYTEIWSATKECIEPYDYMLERMNGSDGYYDYFKRRWAEGEAFINCEHDTVFHKGAIEELENCPEEWCAFGVQMRGEYVTEMINGVERTGKTTRVFKEGAPFVLVLMKFGSSFIEKYPDIWEEMGNADTVYKYPPKWMWCDWWLNYYTRTKGVIPHQHYPPVINANPHCPLL